VALILLALYETDHFEGAAMATERAALWWHLWSDETCWRFSNVWWT